jgi:dipeptide transport system ATP-binding protein
VEQGAKQEVFARPRHPYTQALLASTPFVDPGRRARRVMLKGELPSPLDPPSGCAFHQRCPLAYERCAVERPDLQRVGGQSRVACHAVEDQRA